MIAIAPASRVIDHFNNGLFGLLKHTRKNAHSYTATQTQTLPCTAYLFAFSVARVQLRLPDRNGLECEFQVQVPFGYALIGTRQRYTFYPSLGHATKNPPIQTAKNPRP